MDQSEAREEETIGQPMGNQHATRKGRVTPRQLWALQEGRAASGESSQPAEAQKRRPRARNQDALQASLADHLEVKLQSLQEAGASEAGDPPEKTEQDEPVSEAVVQQSEEQPAEQESPAQEGDAEKQDTEALGEKPPAKMVEPSMQPGTMRYPYATHRLPPEGGREAGAPAGFERRVSSVFVLGVLIIAFALVIGIALIGQHKRIGSLQEQITNVEKLLEQIRSQPPTVILPGP